MPKRFYSGQCSVELDVLQHSRNTVLRSQVSQLFAGLKLLFRSVRLLLVILARTCLRKVYGKLFGRLRVYKTLAVENEKINNNSPVNAHVCVCVCVEGGGGRGGDGEILGYLNFAPICYYKNGIIMEMLLFQANCNEEGAYLVNFEDEDEEAFVASK